MLGLLVQAACASLPLDAPQLAYEHPQHGLTKGPDGWYLTRQSGPWGTPNKSQILRLSGDGRAVATPNWSHPGQSESSFYFSEAFAKACYISDRPLPDRPTSTDTNIWCVDWVEGHWGEPLPAAANINSPASEWSPVISPDGSIYFASDRPGGLGLGDLYHASPLGEVTPLSDTINSQWGEWNLGLSPDGQTLIFEASHRETNTSIPGDLYRSDLVGGVWQPAIPLHNLNTTGSDLMPRFISPTEFIFTTVEDGEARFRRASLITNDDNGAP